MKKILVLFTVMFVALVATAQGNLAFTVFSYEHKGNEIHYMITRSGNTVLVTREGTNKYNSSVLEIPSRVVYEGKVYNVVEIGNEGIKNARNVKKIIVTSGVKNVRMDAFVDCPNLREVFLENGVTRISGKAFNNCPRVVKLSVPGNCEITNEEYFKKQHPKIQIIRR